MEELLEKYAHVLLETCLKVEKNQPLLIRYNTERLDFVRIITKIAYELGVKDIYYDAEDPFLKHEALKNLEIEELKKTTFWNKEIWNTYAKKNAAFLILVSETPGLMKDIDPEKLKELTKYSYATRKEYDNLRDKSEIAWTIAAVPTTEWAKEIYKTSLDPVSDLWNKIFEICHLKEDNPVEVWNEKIARLNERAEKLTNRQFRELVYQNSTGTNIRLFLPKNHIWATGCEKLKNGKEVLVNFPTEEVFTSPDCFSANGVVYSSKPLSYQDVIIDHFYLKFEKGKVIDYYAQEGEETLEKLIHICKNSDSLGEVALVPFDSPISNTNQIYLETLLDENASCHMALGDSFPECIENGTKMEKDDLYENYHLNKCDSHVDFMIGTKDLNIKGITEDEKEVPILIGGNFTIEFE